MDAMLVKQITNFVNKYRASVTATTSNIHDIGTRVWTGPNSVPAYGNVQHVKTQESMFNIAISQNEFRQLIENDLNYEGDIEMINKYEAVRNAWNEYQLALKLCQSYHTV